MRLHPSLPRVRGVSVTHPSPGSPEEITHNTAPHPAPYPTPAPPSDALQPAPSTWPVITSRWNQFWAAHCWPRAGQQPRFSQ